MISRGAIANDVLWTHNVAALITPMATAHTGRCSILLMAGQAKSEIPGHTPCSRDTEIDNSGPTRFLPAQRFGSGA
jgi:hypothetical protein